MLFYLFIQTSLNLQVLDHRLDDQIAVLQFAEIIVKVANAFERCSIRCGEGGGLCLFRGLEPGARDAIAHFFRLQSQTFGLLFFGHFARNNIKQKGRHAGISQVRSYLRPHGSRAN